MRFLIVLLPLALLVSCAAALPLPRDTVSSELAPLNSSDPNPLCIGRCPWCDLLKQYVPPTPQRPHRFPVLNRAPAQVHPRLLRDRGRHLPQRHVQPRHRQHDVRLPLQLWRVPRPCVSRLQRGLLPPKVPQGHGPFHCQRPRRRAWPHSWHVSPRPCCCCCCVLTLHAQGCPTSSRLACSSSSTSLALPHP